MGGLDDFFTASDMTVSIFTFQRQCSVAQRLHHVGGIFGVVRDIIETSIPGGFLKTRLVEWILIRRCQARHQICDIQTNCADTAIELDARCFRPLAWLCNVNFDRILAIMLVNASRLACRKTLGGKYNGMGLGCPGRDNCLIMSLGPKTCFQLSGTASIENMAFECFHVELKLHP